MLLEPDENWWGDKALLDQVLFTTIEDPSATATSFQNGQLDVIETTVPATYSVVEPMIGDGVVLREAAGPNWSHITLNGTEGRPLADPALRQAVFARSTAKRCSSRSIPRCPTRTTPSR